MATRKDVAPMAGVSETTVTRVTNNSGYVSPENRRRVQEVIDKLGYRPNLVARSLRTRSTKQILYLVPTVHNAYYFEVFSGVEDYARKHGYSVVLSRYFDRDSFNQRQFDGVIASGSFMRADPATDVEEEVLYDQPNLAAALGVDVPCEDTSVRDIKPGLQQAVEYVYAQGHRNAAIISRNNDRGFVRATVIQNRFKELGVPVAPENILCLVDENDPENGRLMADFIQNRLKDVTVVFVHNDILAMRLLAALHEREIWVPHDLSVVGCDDTTMAQLSSPPLTTIRIPKYQMGWEAARRLIEHLEGREPEKVMLDTDLVIRSSVRKIN